jgi:phosphopantothenoylcysteine decarboxylase/phosphopantothenate--cysteine ligase
MKILLGVTGSIAAYKAAELLRVLQKRGHEVRVVMTPSATKFVGELTFRTLSRYPVYVDMVTESDEWRPEHIALGEWPDIFLIAPCTANVIAKVAHGLADDLISSTALSMQAPMVIAPAMNDRMWDNAATVSNVAQLKERGIKFVDVGSGDLACGYQAKGRLAELADIVSAVEESVT